VINSLLAIDPICQQWHNSYSRYPITYAE